MFPPRRGKTRGTRVANKFRTQARFNKEIALTNGQPGSIQIILPHPAFPARRHTFTGGLPGFSKMPASASNWLSTGFSGGLRVTSLVTGKACLSLSGASFPLRVLKLMRGGSRVSQDNKKERRSYRTSLLIATLSCYSFLPLYPFPS